MRLETRNKIRQNLISYGFLAAPLVLLTVFVFYPLAHGIYISFMKYEVLKRPVTGGVWEFITHFIGNLEYLQNPVLSGVLFIASIAVFVYLFIKKSLSGKYLALLFILLVVINMIPAGNVFNKTMNEINYAISEDRVLDNKMAERYVKLLEKKYEGEDGIRIITEKVEDDKTRIVVTESIWLGFGHYKRILKNEEFKSFVSNNTWYKALLIIPFLGLGMVFIVSRYKEKFGKKMDLGVKIMTLIAFLTLIVVTWPRMFHDRVWLFYEGMENSLKYLLVVPPIQIASILLAVLVNQRIKGIRFFRTLYYVPVITGIIIIGYSWKWVFNPDGLLNALLQMVHILDQGQKIYWLSDPSIALWVVMFVTFWRGLGYYMVIYMAGLQNIPNDLIEAATIDGANKFQLITRIYLPLLRPTILICTILSTMAALKIFEEIFVLTSGAAQTTTMVYLIYDKAFGGTEFKFGYSSALAVILSLVIGVFTILNFKLNRGDGSNA